jgi:hypothetical protein
MIAILIFLLILSLVCVCYYLHKVGSQVDIIAEEAFLLLKKMEGEGIITINKNKLEEFYSYDRKNTRS